MTKYEACMIFSVAGGEEAVNGLKEKFGALIAENGTVEGVDEWGKRKLAYLIDDEAEGFYVFYTFTAAAEFPAELERRFSINESIMRSIVIRHEDKKVEA